MDNEIKQAAFTFHLNRLDNKYPCGTLSFTQAAIEVGFPTGNSAYLAKRRGKFPLQLVDVGGRERALVAEVAAWLSGVDLRQSSLTKRRGAPRKEERLAKKISGTSSSLASK